MAEVGEPAEQRHHLILGGDGFIGRHVAILLARRGQRVTIANRSLPSFEFPPDIAGRIAKVRFELASADWDSLVEDVDVVHHYAWSSIPASANANPAGDLLMNVSATIGLLDALRRRDGGRVVFTSSGGTVYGKVSNTPIVEDTVLRPITAYGAGKVSAEIYLSLYRAMHGLDCRIARIANPYGAGQNVERGLGAITTFLHRALDGEEIVIWGDGRVVRDFIHIADLASCLAELACVPRSDDFVFNIGTGSSASLNDAIETIEGVLGHSIAVTRTPSRSIDVPINVLCIERVRRVLDWSPRVSLATGIENTIADLKTGRSFSSLI
ncbi:NAD-dependent epimerase/dehydratase family protein [Methylobacterium bullatum]|uniref:dTDP-4-dehydro-6-deoxyglucose reductase n=1 Tax=Methylobacterium bullatum TaxID=570505 RepID=A0A679K9V1_9HYPH|nr:dTDP-4-dehydro-6-deoxyglucose reductase [Methylobacterium bullatum]